MVLLTLDEITEIGLHQTIIQLFEQNSNSNYNKLNLGSLPFTYRSFIEFKFDNEFDTRNLFVIERNEINPIKLKFITFYNKYLHYLQKVRKVKVNPNCKYYQALFITGFLDLLKNPDIGKLL